MLHFPNRMDPDPGGGSGRSTQISGSLNIGGALTKHSSSFVYLEARKRTRWRAWNGKVEVLSEKEISSKIPPPYTRGVSAQVLEDIRQSLRQKSGVKVPGLEKQIHK